MKKLHVVINGIEFVGTPKTHANDTHLKAPNVAAALTGKRGQPLDTEGLLELQTEPGGKGDGALVVIRRDHISAVWEE